MVSSHSAAERAPGKLKMSAEILLPSKGIAEDIEFWTAEKLGFRVDQIYPADNPQVVALSGNGLRMRLDTNASTPPSVIRLLCDKVNRAWGGETELTSPSGTRVVVVESEPPWKQPSTQHAFMARRLKDNAPWVIGRAGSEHPEDKHYSE